jgi:hypothetical protein
MTTICEQGKPHACLVQATTHPAAKKLSGQYDIIQLDKRALWPKRAFAHDTASHGIAANNGLH